MHFQSSFPYSSIILIFILILIITSIIFLTYLVLPWLVACSGKVLRTAIISQVVCRLFFLLKKVFTFFSKVVLNRAILWANRKQAASGLYHVYTFYSSSERNGYIIPSVKTAPISEHLLNKNHACPNSISQQSILILVIVHIFMTVSNHFLAPQKMKLPTNLRGLVLGHR